MVSGCYVWYMGTLGGTVSTGTRRLVCQRYVYGTRSWKVFGEGPVAESSNPIQDQCFNEGRYKPYTSEDIRFVVKGDVLYDHVLAFLEDNRVTIQSLSY